MSKIQWEYDLVEKPFCKQLKAMGWQWIEGDTDIPDFTEWQNFREVLFVNGIPVGVAEFKSPGIENPLQEAINQLLRYTNQRREIWPTLYTDNEGVELGVLPQSPEEPQAAQELAAAGAEKSDWGGIPLFFRQRDKRPEVLRGGVGASLQASRFSQPVCCGRHISWTSSEISPCSNKSKARRARWWRATSSSAPSTMP